ncbi:MAG TPA: glycosyltransferase [Candidatus Sulfotelmatobacter sp.]|jgi:glycosyltransferase involved in cell wall biosynthesis|nr:glycosyltransferase [Candidatus Sulfotelmatobacter sp.]
MKLKDSVVTVILPVYNTSKFLPDCLNSLALQTYQEMQIIVIDDHSRDDSIKILRQYKKRFANFEIYKNKKRYGLAVCYNRALKRTRGKFVTFMNPHDINAISRFKRQVNFLLNNPKTVAVGTQYTLIDEANRKLDRSDLPEEHETIYDTLIHTSSLKPETVMINRELLPKDLLYFKNNKYPFIYTEVFLKFFQYGKVANIRQSLYFHREGIKQNGRQLSKLNNLTSMIKIWLSSRSDYDYRPSLRSILPQMVKGI